MGEPIVDLSPDRASRTIRRVITNSSVLGMYGDPGFVTEMVRRVRRVATESQGAEMPGRVVYDVEPVEFDDLIEIRTGGDRAMQLFLTSRRGDGYPQWVSFWPVNAITTDEVMEGWEATIDEVRDTIHQVTVEMNSPLEQALTFDFGYQTALRDDGPWRQLTRPQWVEEIREQDRLRREAARRVLDSGYDKTGRIEEILQRESATRMRRESATRMSGYATANANLASLVVEPQPMTVDIHPFRLVEEEAQETPRETHLIVASDGLSVRVSTATGLDAESTDPLLPGYRTGGCNCDDCRETRLGDDPDEPSAEDDYDYDDDPPEDDDYEEEE